VSFDLTLRQRDGRFNETAVLDWFRARPLYEVGGPQALYGSADTGVHFIFDVGCDPEEGYDVAFMLNYFRPSYFVLEAEPEVTAFVRHFDFVVTDPQLDGMGEDNYSGAGLIASWNRSNEITLPSFLRDPVARQTPTLPTARLTALWRWNHGRKALQDSLGDRTFVPKIFILRVDGQLQTAIVWGDGMPIVLPTVDIVILHRQQIAPWRLFGRRSDQALMSWAEVTALVAPYGAPHASGALVLTYDQPPKALLNRLKSLPTTQVKPDIVSPDGVLDREIVERALAEQQ
jgi:hypothetical protein